MRLLLSLTALAFIVATAPAFKTYVSGRQSDACGYYTNSSGHEVPRPCGDWRNNPGAAPSGATALCADGRYSYSEHPYASGTCSYHGGVVQHLR